MTHEPGIRSCSSSLGQNLYQYPSIVSFLFPVGPIHTESPSGGTSCSSAIQGKIVVPKGQQVGFQLIKYKLSYMSILQETFLCHTYQALQIQSEMSHRKNPHKCCEKNDKAQLELKAFCVFLCVCVRLECNITYQYILPETILLETLKL